MRYLLKPLYPNRIHQCETKLYIYANYDIQLYITARTPNPRPIPTVNEKKITEDSREHA